MPCTPSRLVIITTFWCLGSLQPLAAQSPPVDEEVRITATGQLEQTEDGAALHVRDTLWVIVPRTEAQGKQIAELIGAKVIVIGDLEPAGENRNAAAQISVRAIRRSEFIVRLLADDEGELRGIRVTDDRVVKDKQELNQYLTRVRPNEITIQYDTSLDSKVVNEYHMLAHQVGAQTGTQRISLAKLEETEKSDDRDASSEQEKTGDKTTDLHPKFDIGGLQWLSGTWSRPLSDGEVEEFWNDPKGGIMLGIHRSISREGVSFKFLRITQIDDRIICYVSPGGGPPTPFVLTQLDENLAIFESKKNDYPQRVVYERDRDALLVEMEGRGPPGRPRVSKWRYTKSP